MKERACSQVQKAITRGKLGLGESMHAMDTTRAKDHLFAKSNIRIKRENHDLAKIVLRASKWLTKSLYLPLDQPKVDVLYSWHLDIYGLVILQSTGQITKVHWCAELGITEGLPKTLITISNGLSAD